MNDRPTPETEAHIEGLIQDPELSGRAFTLDFCRKLERERDEAREKCAAMKCERDKANRLVCDTYDALTLNGCDLPSGIYSMPNRVRKLERERDEAREDTPWHSNGETKDEWLSRQREKYAVLERERDEARADLEFRRGLYKVLEEANNRLMAVNDEVRERAERYRLEANAMMMQRDEAREALSEIALYLSVGMGDETITAQQYQQRILDGIKMLTDPIVNLWKQAAKERDEAREVAIGLAEQAERLRKERDDAWACCDELVVDSNAITLAKTVMRLERERDEAREDLEEEKKFHHRTHAELIQTQCRLMDVKQAIIATLEENRHLADGDDCTLSKLKSVVPDWE